MKTIYAQRSGAIGVIIVAGYDTYRPEALRNEFDVKGAFALDTSTEAQDDELESVKIPCFVIASSIGEPLRDFARTNKI
jgi:hypothetical protein